MVNLFTWTLCWVCLCFELHVVMMRSMGSIIWEQLLLHCQTIEQWTSAKQGRGKPHADNGREVVKQVFLVDVLYGRPLRMIHNMLLYAHWTSFNIHT